MSIHLTQAEESNALHVALGALFVVFPVAWRWKHPRILGSFIGLVFAAVKEFSWDIYFEDEETSGGWVGGIVDFLGYLVGIGVANLLLFL